MSIVQTVKIKTGPNDFIIVNECDADAYQYMKYEEPVTIIPDPVETVTDKKKSRRDSPDVYATPDRIEE